MSPSSDRLANAIILVLTLGLAALYGGVTALVLWGFNFPEPMEVGSLVFRVAGGLGLVVALLLIAYLSPSRPFGKPMSRFEIFFFYFACFAGFILTLPLGLLSFGRFWRWVGGTPKEEGRS